MAAVGGFRMLRGRAREIAREVPGARALARRLRTLAGRRPVDIPSQMDPGSVPQDMSATERGQRGDPEPKVVADLRRARWLADGRLEIAGWAYIHGTASVSDSLAIAAVDSEGGRRVDFEVRPDPSDEVNAVGTDAGTDHAHAGFVALLDAEQLLREEGSGVFERNWEVQITIPGLNDPISFLRQYRWGSAGMLLAEEIAGSCLVRPTWQGSRGLVLVVARRAVSARSSTFTADGSLTLDLEARGKFWPKRLLLRNKDQELVFELVGHGSGSFIATLDLAPLAEQATESRASWYVHLADGQGRSRHAHWSGQGNRGITIPSPACPMIAVQHGPSGVLRIDVVRQRVVIDSVSVAEEPAAGNAGESEPQAIVTVRGRCFGWDELPEFVLQGARRRSAARSVTGSPAQFSAAFPLESVPQWGAKAAVLDTGGYRVVAESEREGVSSKVEATVDTGLGEELYRSVHTDRADVRIERDPQGRLYLHVGPPRGEREWGAFNQERLKRTVYLAPLHRARDAVYFESFSGKSANDNTRALHDEIHRRRPDLERFWAVADLSVDVPDGVTKMVIHSPQWWEILAQAKFVVTNCWLPGAFVRAPHQTVLQAWHGTPLKSLGLDRIGARERVGYASKMLREVGMWSMLIAQNPYSAEIFRRAYGFDQQMLEIGYPRNDVLSVVPAGHATAIRQRLGVDPDQKLILYVPTWREDDKTLTRTLDFSGLLGELGPDYRLLVRGHSNTIRHDRTIEVPGVVDVTMYPEISDLYLVADVMITDYSSVMFDFSVTGKPMIFFTPDLERYASSLRGTYFALAEEAPGPVVSTTSEVAQAIGNLSQTARQFKQSYDRWQRRFNPWDDGQAAKRAVDSLFADVKV